MAGSASATARTRARQELTREIKDAARRQLVLVGSAGLSLRAVAREMGMVSSAVYRYFPSRDELLTALIIDAFDAIGAEAEVAHGAAGSADATVRWLAVTRAVRAWALAHRQEYSLIYGTPVPGYDAPAATVGHATRMTEVLLRILHDAVAARSVVEPIDAKLPPRAELDLATLRDRIAPDVPVTLLARGLMAWTLLIGTISFELFGHLHNVVEDYDAFFDLQMREIAVFIGFAPVAAHE